MWHGDPNFSVVLIVAIVFSSLIAIPILIGSLIYRNSQKRREAELIRLAIEKGQPVPSFPEKASQYATLKIALVWLGGGIGWIFMIIVGEILDWVGVSIGIVPIFIGVALLIGWMMEKKANGNRQSTA
jgi:putative Mn2+ efflux pump MntP